MSDQTHHHPVAVLPKGERRGIMLHGALIFLGTGALALISVAAAGPSGYVPSSAVTLPYFLAMFLLLTLLIVIALSTVRRPAVFEALFTLAMLSGAWFVADVFLPPALALVVGGAIVLLRFAWKTVLSMNLCLAVGIAGIAASIGADLTPNAALILLTLLSFYDIVAVYGTRHMVRMAQGLNARGVLFAFALPPPRPGAFTRPVGQDATAGGMLLGTGDVAMPVMLAASALRVGLVPAVASLVGAALGFVLMFSLFLAKARRRPMAALPPIALGAILGYGLSLLILS